MRVITFSRQFPTKHPKAGQPTDFIQKIWKGLYVDAEYTVYSNLPIHMPSGKWRIPVMWRDNMIDEGYAAKHHTIRGGERWKVGDWFSPRIWSGKPYASKQIQFAPPIEIKKIWTFEMKPRLWFDECEYFINGKRYCGDELIEVAKNDGLEIIDFACWFAGSHAASTNRKPFVGQIVSWSNQINYGTEN